MILEYMFLYEREPVSLNPDLGYIKPMAISDFLLYINIMRDDKRKIENPIKGERKPIL